MDIADAKCQKREAEEEVLEVLRDLERDSGLAVDRLKMRTVEHVGGDTSVMDIEIEVKL